MGLVDSIPGFRDNHIPLEYVQIATSAEVTNTTVETAFDKTYDFSANRAKIGDIIRITAWGTVPGQQAADTLQIRLRIGATLLINSGTVDVATNDQWRITFDAVVLDGGLQGMGTTFLGTKLGGSVLVKAKLAGGFDYSVTSTIACTAQWSVAAAANRAVQNGLTVQLLQPERTS